MVLKSLILQGFKSFPDRTEIKFLGGMTAIVGPNGSGKSNISDAIRWVLGEQSSRSLRGAKMEDVIFSGTAKRGPVGFAEVSLILDNSTGVFRSPFTEIMVTRRYYRSGESEYYLGKKHCRLKDIRELFMDTGLGRDGYSSIGQGRIDEILSLKSEDRREIFEEAAGITKFRVRKEEAERRLAATEENLTRIRDLYDELTRQLEPLERQAEKAEQYLALKSELRVLEVSLWLRQLNRLKADADKLSRDAETCRAQLEQAKTAQEQLYSRADRLTGELHEIDREIDALRASLRESERNAAEQESRIAVLRANIENAQRNIERVQAERAEREKQAESLDAQLTARKTRVDALETEKNGLQDTLSALNAEKAAQQAQTDAALRDLEEAERRREDARNALHELALGRTAAQSGLSGMDDRQDSLRRECESAEAQLRDAENAQQDMDTRAQNSGAALKERQTALYEADAALRKAKTDAERCGTALRQAQSALTDAENRAAMLRDMQRDFEGFSRSVKSVMQQASRGGLSGVRGPVSALISTESRFVTAIDTALGASASSIVVETAENGKKCIEYLRRTDGGRATFLPLDTIRPAFLRESGLEREHGCCGTADSLVRFEEKYGAVVRNLLARTVVCENMDAALALARSRGHRFRIVTLDGQVIQSGGAMTGGSASRGTGALARAGRLKAAEEQVQHCKSALTDAENRLKEAEKQQKNYETAASEQSEAVRREAEQQAALTAACTQHRVLLDSVRARYEELSQQRQRMDEEKQRGADALASFEERQAQAENRLKEAEERVQTCREAQMQRRSDAEQLDARLSEARNALTRTDAALESEKRALSQMQTLKDELHAGLSGTQESVARLKEETRRLDGELHDAQTAREQAEALTYSTQEKLTQAGEKREQLEARQNEARRDAQNANEQILGLERESSRLENRVGQLKAEERQILDRMWENYELTPTPAESIAEPLDDPAAARERAHALRTQLRALGSVSTDAVEEYRRVRERCTFMGEQKDDLEQAQRELYKVIDRLTVNMKEIFASEFAKLNVLFGQTFREIFGGGHAEITLADTSDILSCGIDIRVSPPGKAVKTITLLSGGEKAFVAIALYFAILKLRPTPFCVLDEIEAALDDVNVQRYAKYIRKLTDFTQFIVITHRRGTMEEADMLYGVTMQEQGVSKLLMLNLAEAEKRLKNTIK
nr:chromosome segregation protein SMC [uncultured Agathobaculum sp.]